MPEPIAYTLVHARLRAILAGQTKIEPAASMQLRIRANHSAAVLWWFGNGRGYAVVWYEREEQSALVTTDYYAALDTFCQLCKIPPLDSRQPYARLWEQAQKELLRAPVVTTPEPVAPAPVVVRHEVPDPEPRPAVETVVAPPVVATPPPPPPPMNGRARLRSQLEMA